jgi:endonuclease-3
MTNTKRIRTIIRLLQNETKFLQIPIVERVARKRDPYRILVSTMLSLRTKDATTEQASLRLFKYAPSINRLAGLSVSMIAELIYPVGFYKTKAKHLRAMALSVINQHKGKIPGREDALLALPGVGRKTANLVLSLGFSQDAICVDTHVHRISNRLGLIRTKTPYESEIALQKILPRRYWQFWNMWLVMWGQKICVPISPKCSLCPLSKVCPKRNVTRRR